MKKIMGYLTDILHERRIARARHRVMAAVSSRADSETKRNLWEDLRRLIGQRSGAQVERMERRVGLR